MEKYSGLSTKVNKLYRYCIVTTMSSSIDNWIKPFLPLYNANNFDLTVICNMTSNYERQLKEEYPYVKPINIPMPRGVNLFKSIKATYLLYKVLKKGKYHMVQYSTPNASLYTAIASYLARVPIRLYCQWGMVYVTMRGLKRFIFQCIERIICLLSSQIQPDSFGNLNYAEKMVLLQKEKLCYMEW